MASKRRPSDIQSASPIRNFTLTTAERVAAIVTGAPAWARRRKQIEDLTELIVEAHRAGRVSEAKKKIAQLVTLVTAHNTYYPMEANLPLDPETSRLMEGGTPWKPMPRPTLESILAAADAEDRAPTSLAWSDGPGGLCVMFDANDERYTLRLDEDAFSCVTEDHEIAHITTSRIEEILSDPGVAIVTFDAETVRLPFEIDEALCAAIASELGARLRTLHAAASNYRGEP